MPTNYTFAVNLLDASANPTTLAVWQSGTLTLDLSAPDSVTGALTIPGFYTESIPFSGSALQPSTLSGTTITAAGENTEAAISLTIDTSYDGFLYSGSYLGGLVNILDNAAEESYLYVIQGLSPQGGAGAVFRGNADGMDKRKPRIR